MRDTGAGTDAFFQSTDHRRLNGRGFVLPVEHQNHDKILDASRFALGTAETVQKDIQGVRPAPAPLEKRPGTVKGHGTLLNQLKIMIGIKTPLVIAVQAIMNGQLPPSRKKLNTIHGEQHLYRKPRVAARNGVTVLVHDDRGILVGTTGETLHIAEGMLRKGNKMLLLRLEEILHGPVSTSYGMGSVKKTLPQYAFVELLQAVRFRKGNHVVAPGKPYQPLNAALLVTIAGSAEPSLKRVIGAEGPEGLLFTTILALKHLLDRRCQIIVDHHGKHTAKKSKGPNVGIKKGLLTLARIKPDKVFPRILATHTEKLHPCLLAGYDRRGRTPVNLGLETRLRVTGNESARQGKSQLHLGKTNIAANRGLGTTISMLRNQTIINPACRMTLLPGLVTIAQKPLIDSAHVPFENRKGLMLPLLVSPRLSTNGLLDRVAGMTRHPGYITDRLTIHAMTRPYHLILTHLEHPLSSSPCSNQWIKYHCKRKKPSSGWSILGYH